jgi:hypothetical protein
MIQRIKHRRARFRTQRRRRIMIKIDAFNRDHHPIPSSTTSLLSDPTNETQHKKREMLAFYPRTRAKSGCLSNAPRYYRSQLEPTGRILEPF